VSGVLRVLLQARSDAFANFGGDTYQFTRYRDAVKSLGCEITITTEQHPALRGYDIYHVNTLDMPCELYQQVRRARNYGVPIALMPIHHKWAYVKRYYAWLAKGHLWYKPFGNRRVKEFTKLLSCGQFGIALATPWQKSIEDLQRYCVEVASVTLLNAEEEGEVITQQLGVTGRDSVLVPNGVDPPESVAEDDEEIRGLPPVYGVVVGRIEPRKNQLAVLRAMVPIGLPLVFLGARNRLYPWYYRDFLHAVGRADAVYLGNVTPKVVKAIVKKAAVSILASWFEVVPYASLDSYSMGTRVVTTERGYAQEYFGRGVSYCAPDSESAIAAAVARELDRDQEAGMHRRFVERYDWEVSARRLLEGYEKCV